VLRQLSRAVESTDESSIATSSGASAETGGIVQRQADPNVPADGGTTATGGGQTPGGATPASGGPWTPDLLDIGLQDKATGTCLGTVGAGGGLIYSKKCPSVTGPFCQPAGTTFLVDFTVDATNLPRPAGFTPPTVWVHMTFVNGAGTTTQTIDKKDSKPTYVAPGSALKTSFGQEISVGTSESGSLHIHLQLADPDSGKTIDYFDTIQFIVTPCT